MFLGTRLWVGAAGKGVEGGWCSAGCCSGGTGVRGSVLVKAGLGGGTEGLKEVKVVALGFDEVWFWC